MITKKAKELDKNHINKYIGMIKVYPCFIALLNPFG